MVTVLSDGLVAFCRVAAMALVALLGACASLTVADTVPLSPSALAPPDSDSISVGGYRLSALSAPGYAPDLLVLVAMSGGGKRSASFGYGALKGMREVSVPLASGPSPLLHQVSAIAGVSGGSFPAAYYGLYHDAAFGRFETDFLYQDTESYIWGIYLLPWNWTWLADPLVGTNDFMERVYDRAMFHGATYRDLAQRGRPVIGVGATDLAYGNPVLFTQESFDLICSDIEKFPLARAVAASNGFPGLFSPITLTNHARLWRPQTRLAAPDQRCRTTRSHCRGSACRLSWPIAIWIRRRPATCISSMAASPTTSRCAAPVQ